MIESTKLIERLDGLDHLQSNAANLLIVAFATEVVNVVLELKNELREIDGLRERIERLEDNA